MQTSSPNRLSRSPSSSPQKMTQRETVWVHREAANTKAEEEGRSEPTDKKTTNGPLYASPPVAVSTATHLFSEEDESCGETLPSFTEIHSRHRAPSQRLSLPPPQLRAS